ncbi:MAG TPA: thioredoxin-like domain-containing protein [Puia sp.]|jgi:peroxiredoxin|nr:thioredoxin-like domain-containing protein [Puia sp.]
MRSGKIYFFLFLSFISTAGFGQQGHNIKLTLKPYKNSLIYLAYYYGKLKAVADSTTLDGDSKGAFVGKEKLPGGIYLVVSPRKEILFEVLLDSQQHFSISVDTLDITHSLTFTGSPDNKTFQDYTELAAKNGKAIADLQKDYAASKKDSIATIDKIKKLNQEIQNYRDDIEKKSPNSLLATIFITMKEPVIPPADKQPGGKYDTAFAYRYFKSHYWDGVTFTDERIVRTPVFEPKLEKYFRDLVPHIADSINKEVDWMLLYARVSPELFKYLLVHFVQKYVNPEYMGEDAVFVHLFNKFINTGQAEFFTEKYRKFLNDRAYSMMANLIGDPAANLIMVDSLNKPTPLYEVNANFVVVCFWDPTCSHCKEEVPKLDSIYNAKWKAEGVKMYGVMVDGGKTNWERFIQEHHLDWINVYETKEQHDAVEAAGKPGYKQLYDVYQTPTLFLLDKDKRIIAKQLSYQQFDKLITLKLNKTKSN